MCGNVCDSAAFLSVVWEWEQTQNSSKGLGGFWGNSVLSSHWPKLLLHILSLLLVFFGVAGICEEQWMLCCKNSMDRTTQRTFCGPWND